jgi:hypothetical protein
MRAKMIRLDLSEDERRVLLETLESELSELRVEIAHTDSMDFKETLKSKKAILEKAIGALREAGS